MPRHYQRWTEAELQLLRQRYPNTHTSELAAQLGRPRQTVAERARKLGLRKSQAFLRGLYGDQVERLQRTGADARFQKGMVPHNKGKRMPGRGRSLETQFKDGHMPSTWVPVGTRRWRKGAWWLKVADTRNKRADWKPLSHVLLEQAGIPVPRGHVARFRDGNPSNLSLDNLEVITRAENARRNSPYAGRYPPELRDLITQKALLTRAIHQAERAAQTQSESNHPATPDHTAERQQP